MRVHEASFIDKKSKTSNQKMKITIRHGEKFNIVDGLFTNFHLPKSTLLMLVSAFAGYEFTKEIYTHAISKKYRFFSYGDAIFIEKKMLKEDLYNN